MYKYEYDYTIGSKTDNSQENNQNRKVLKFFVGFAVLIFLAGVGVLIYEKTKTKQ